MEEIKNTVKFIKNNKIKEGDLVEIIIFKRYLELENTKKATEYINELGYRKETSNKQDVKNKQGIRIKMQKVSKDIEIAFNPILKRSLDEYCEDKETNEFLYNKSIDKSQAYRIIKDIVAVQLALVHRDSSTTLRYIGVLQSNINASINIKHFYIVVQQNGKCVKPT